MSSTNGSNLAEAKVSAQTVMLGLGVAAPFATFAIAVSGLDQNVKVVLLVGLSVLYASVCIWALSRLNGYQSDSFNGKDKPGHLSDLEQKLLSLEDAREFFGTSLRPADMFRLVANRIKDIVPFSSCVFLVNDPEAQMLRCTQAYGASANQFENLRICSDSSLGGLSFYSGEIETTNDLSGELKTYPTGLLDAFRSSTVIPLKVDDETFAVLQLFFSDEAPIGEESLDNLHAIAERISPLFVGTMAYEKSLSNALSDPLTKLPNERAFLMVLENQLAESLRFRDDRPLTVLAVDIRNFEEINRDHGHAVGDRALSFAAEKISSQLRKMDFLARSMNDEFLIVLPKATERTTIEITGRIQSALSTAPLVLNDDEHLKLWLNFGWAVFWRDGETSHQLITGAFARKQQAKSEEPENSVFLPKEYVN